jgi:hypothetical protein
MNGVAGRKALVRSILPPRDAGGIELADGSRVPVNPSWPAAVR